MLVNESVRDVIYISDQLTETDEEHFLFKIHMTSWTSGLLKAQHAFMWLMLTCSSSFCRLRSSSIRTVTWSSCVCADDCSTDDITEHKEQLRVQSQRLWCFGNAMCRRKHVTSLWIDHWITDSLKKQNTDSFRNKTLCCRYVWSYFHWWNRAKMYNIVSKILYSIIYNISSRNKSFQYIFFHNIENFRLILTAFY